MAGQCQEWNCNLSLSQRNAISELIHPTSPHAIVKRSLRQRGCDEQPASGVWMDGGSSRRLFLPRLGGRRGRWGRLPAGRGAGNRLRSLFDRAWRQAGRRGGPLPRAGYAARDWAASGAPDPGRAGALQPKIRQCRRGETPPLFAVYRTRLIASPDRAPGRLSGSKMLACPGRAGCVGVAADRTNL